MFIATADQPMDSVMGYFNKIQNINQLHFPKNHFVIYRWNFRKDFFVKFRVFRVSFFLTRNTQKNTKNTKKVDHEII
jgi:hypothetical protein